MAYKEFLKLATLSKKQWYSVEQQYIVGVLLIAPCRIICSCLRPLAGVLEGSKAQSIYGNIDRHRASIPATYCPPSPSPVTPAPGLISTLGNSGQRSETAGCRTGDTLQYSTGDCRVYSTVANRGGACSRRPSLQSPPVFPGRRSLS